MKDPLSKKQRQSLLMPHSERRKLIELPFPVVRSLSTSKPHGGCMTLDDKVRHEADRMDTTVYDVLRVEVYPHD